VVIGEIHSAGLPPCGKDQREGMHMNPRRTAEQNQIASSLALLAMTA
jgi:hypothetical protein